MFGRIENGILEILRGEKYIKQECRYYAGSKEHGYIRYCGDWCPLLEEGDSKDIFINCGGKMVHLDK